jgi:hypothetical protein
LLLALNNAKFVRALWYDWCQQKSHSAEFSCSDDAASTAEAVNGDSDKNALRPTTLQPWLQQMALNG